MSIRREIHPTRQRIARELQKGVPLSKHDLSERCFISCRNANEYLRIMHSDGEIHIAAYHQVSGRGTPSRYWLYGPGIDAKKPKAKPPAQKTREYRERNPEQVLKEINRKRATCQACEPETSASTTGQSVSSCAV
jgi:MarR-like DNA-binding transcriptional regulator SgrR of sgrS sRNA